MLKLLVAPRDEKGTEPGKPAASTGTLYCATLCSQDNTDIPAPKEVPPSHLPPGLLPVPSQHPSIPETAPFWPCRSWLCRKAALLGPGLLSAPGARTAAAV